MRRLSMAARPVEIDITILATPSHAESMRAEAIRREQIRAEMRRQMMQRQMMQQQMMQQQMMQQQYGMAGIPQLQKGALPQLQKAALPQLQKAALPQVYGAQNVYGQAYNPMMTGVSPWGMGTTPLYGR